MRDPRAEAEDMLGGDYEARVLEPSPPAVIEDPWTDDPVAPGEVPEGRRLVSPVHGRGDLTWDEIAREEPDLVPWCAERWLGAWKRLEQLPATFAETRIALHKVTEAVVSPARQPPNEISLRYTRGGFGTPFYEQDGEDCQVRVEHGELVRQRGPVAGFDPLLMPVVHALIQVREDLERLAGEVPAEHVWLRPGGSASIGLMPRTIAINGTDLTHLADGERVAFRNRHVGFVFQFHHLLPEFTAVENAEMPMRIARLDVSDARQRASELLRRVGLGERLTHRPGMLSGGEQQRVAVARALIMRPSVLLADEPTGDLDEATADALHQLLRDMHREFGLTAIIATHNPRLAAQCDRTLRLEGRRLTSI